MAAGSAGPDVVAAARVVPTASENLRDVGHAIIEVPAMTGDPSHAAADGPAVLAAALATARCRPNAHRVTVPSPQRDTRVASCNVGRRVAGLVRQVAARGQAPVVLAGSCDVAPGVLAGIRDADLGVVWIDAHADFNTPESSVSGFWPGMTLAVVVGDCGDEVWSALEWRPVAPQRVALFGVRSLSPPEESHRLQRSAVTVVPWQDGLPQVDVASALDRLRDEVKRVYVHLDLDALDPTIGLGVVDPPVPGGISEAQLVALVDRVRERFAVAGATIAAYTPAEDDGSTLPVAVLAVRRLISCS
jgi:arginase